MILYLDENETYLLLLFSRRLGSRWISICHLLFSCSGLSLSCLFISRGFFCCGGFLCYIRGRCFFCGGFPFCSRGILSRGRFFSSLLSGGFPLLYRGSSFCFSGCLLLLTRYNNLS